MCFQAVAAGACLIESLRLVALVFRVVPSCRMGLCIRTGPSLLPVGNPRKTTQNDPLVFRVGAMVQDGDVYPDWPQDLDDKDHDTQWWIAAVAALKAAGTEHFKVHKAQL